MNICLNMGNSGDLCSNIKLFVWEFLCLVFYAGVKILMDRAFMCPETRHFWHTWLLQFTTRSENICYIFQSALLGKLTNFTVQDCVILFLTWITTKKEHKHEVLSRMDLILMEQTLLASTMLSIGKKVSLIHLLLDFHVMTSDVICVIFYVRIFHINCFQERFFSL